MLSERAASSNLFVTGLSDDEEAKRMRQWAWNCSDPPCVYRYAINNQRSFRFDENDSYGKESEATYGSVTGIYYLHVQARNERRGESLVHTFRSVFDNAGPLVESSRIRVPPVNLYERGALNFSFEFNESVQVEQTTSWPRLSLVIGETTVYADYVSGSGTETLIFSYEITGGDRDDDGITFLNTALDLNGGNILDSLGNSMNNTTFSPPSLSGVRVNARRPYLTQAVTVPGYHREGTTVTMTATFNEIVFIDISSGRPRLQLDVSGKTAFAEYVGSSLSAQSHTFSYVVSSGENDSDGLEVTGVSLSGGTVVNDLGHSVVMSYVDSVEVDVEESGAEVERSRLVIDTTDPMVTGLSGDYIPRKSHSWNWGCNEEGCTYRHLVNNNSDPHKFSTEEGGSYDGVQSASVATGDGRFYVHVRARDLAGNESIAFTASAMLDNTPPMLVNTEIGVPVDNTYSVVGDELDFTIDFNEQVFVDTSLGVPSFSLRVGSRGVLASYVEGADPLVGMEQLTFRYEVVIGDEDYDGIELLSTDLQLNNSIITDQAGNEAVISSFSQPDLEDIFVDARAPTLDSVQASEEGSYGGDDQLGLIATFSERVTVTGIPKLIFSISGASLMAEYSGGSPGKKLYFEYDILNGQNDHDGIEITGIDLSSGSASIEDSFNRGVVTTLDDPIVVANVYVDTVAPTLESVSLPSGNYRESDHLDITLTFSEEIYVEENGSNSIRIQLIFNTGGTKYAEYLSGSSTQNLIFRYTIEAGVRDPNGVGMGSTVDLNGGVIRDGAYYHYDSGAGFMVPNNLNQVLVLD